MRNIMDETPDIREALAKEEALTRIVEVTI